MPEEPSSPELWSRTLQATEPQLAVASRQQEGKGSALSSPAPSLAASPALCSTLGPGGGPVNSPFLTAHPCKSRARRARGHSPRARAHFAHPLSGPRPFTASLCMSD